MVWLWWCGIRMQAEARSNKYKNEICVKKNCREQQIAQYEFPENCGVF